MTLSDRQKLIREKLNIPLDIDLETLIKPVQPSTNKSTKKEIMSILNKKQKELVNFHLKDKHKDMGLTIQHLDPRQNRYNSVRYQFLKHSGHFLKQSLQKWNCHQDGCDYFTTQTKIYFISFGKDKKTICIERNVHADDYVAVGADASTKHLFNQHPDFTTKRLGEMGVKVQ